MNLNAAIQSIIEELEYPYNQDLLMAVIHFGETNDGTGGNSFMYGFAVIHQEPADFESFANVIRTAQMQLLEQGFDIQETVNMSMLYDSYLSNRDEGIAKSGISTWQAKRFEVIVGKHDDGGWSGSVYGFVCRQVQSKLRMKYRGSN